MSSGLSWCIAADDVGVSDAVGDALGVILSDVVMVGVIDAEGLVDSVELAENEDDSDSEDVAVSVTSILGSTMMPVPLLLSLVGITLPDTLGVSEGVALSDSTVDCDSLIVGVGDADGLPMGFGLTDAVSVPVSGEADSVTFPTTSMLGEMDGESCTSVELLALIVTVSLGWKEGVAATLVTFTADVTAARTMKLV